MRKKRESGAYECVAENGVGDEVSVSAELEVYDGKISLLLSPTYSLDRNL